MSIYNAIQYFLKRTNSPRTTNKSEGHIQFIGNIMLYAKGKYMKPAKTKLNAY